VGFFFKFSALLLKLFFYLNLFSLNLQKRDHRERKNVSNRVKYIKSARNFLFQSKANDFLISLFLSFDNKEMVKFCAMFSSLHS